MRAVLVANGAAPAHPTAQRAARRAARRGGRVRRRRARIARRRCARSPTRLRASGRRPFVIPIGASTPLGALGFVRAMLELLDQMPAPDVIVHATSSGGHAGRARRRRAGCWGCRRAIIGISADDSSASLAVAGAQRSSPASASCSRSHRPRRDRTAPMIEVDDRFVGGGYGMPTDGVARGDRARARGPRRFFSTRPTPRRRWPGLIAYVRQQRFTPARPWCSGIPAGRSGSSRSVLACASQRQRSGC